MHVLFDDLSSPQLYKDEISKLQSKWQRQPNKLSKDESLIFYQICLYKNKFSRLLANSIKNESYHFDIGSTIIINIGKKKQAIIVNSITNRIVQGVIYQLLSQYADNIFSESLTSYRRGYSCYKTILSFRQYIQKNTEK